MSTVLVIEDNRMIRTMYAAGLTGYGYDVAEIANVKDAMAYLQSQPLPEVILLDLKLPDGSGQRIIDHVRQSANGHDVRIIVASAMPPEYVPEAVTGADSFVSKPLELVDLLDLIKSFSRA